MLIASAILLGLCSVLGGKATTSVRLQAGSEISVSAGTAAMYIEAQHSTAIFKENVYEGLLYIPSLDDTGTVKDCLSESHTVSDDGLTWSFKIRGDLKYSDDSVCDAKAIAAYFDICPPPEYYNIAFWTFTDENKFVLTLSDVYPDFEKELCTALYIGSAEAIKNFGQDSLSAAVGTGPYMLHGITENCATLKANPYYSFSPKAPAIETINILFNPFSTEDVVNGLLSGNLDVSFPIHRSTIDTFESAGWDGCVNIIYNSPQTIWLNVQTVDAFKNMELRAAVSKLIDLNEINSELYGGLGKVQYGLWPESSELYVPKDNGAFSQEDILETLTQADINPETVTLPYISLFSDTEIICRQLESAGFTTEEIDLPAHMITGTSASKGAFISHTYPEQISPVNSIDSILNSPVNPCCFQELYDAELYNKIQDEFEKLKQATSRNEMITHAKNITRYLQDDYALIGGISAPSVFPVSARLDGCEYSPLTGSIRLYSITLK